ncbi:MAG TPA: zinc-binding alcohol dehydrogenase family protein [Actinophytocola sp.]|uniref:zinc-binding alcohol dehydrogenase family protein n=1 Tax=Actinophytocola sp. TaxID=1872138 RepID=UPI002F91E5F3
MRAVVLIGPGPVENLELREIPIPEPGPGWVRIRIGAFGLNRSELHTRLGLAEGVTFPRVPGIECAGTIDLDPSGELPAGQQVAAMMGGMGRTFDGGYAEYTVVPRALVIPFRSGLAWEVLGAVPETLQTAYGSLTVGLDLRAGQTVLIRGGTSSVGLAAAALAKDMGATVLATTRGAERIAALKAHGVDHPILDNGRIADEVRELVPGGVDGAIELVGTPTLPDTLAATRVHGTVCFTGMLSNEWIVRDFYPISYLPNGVRLTGYGGESADLPAEVLQRYLDGIAAGRVDLGAPRVYRLDGIRDAHAEMEHNRAVGKLVVLP